MRQTSRMRYSSLAAPFALATAGMLGEIGASEKVPSKIPMNAWKISPGDDSARTTLEPPNYKLAEYMNHMLAKDTPKTTE